MSTESVPSPLADQPSEPAAGDGGFRARGSLLALILLATGATWAEYFPPVITLLPLRVRAIAPDDYTTALSVALAISSVIGLVAGPIAGAVSDRSRSRFGRRRFWLVVFSVTGLVGNTVVGLAGDLVTFTIGASICQAGFGATMAVLFALIPEHVHPDRRGKVGGYLGIGTAVATVVGVGITASLAFNPPLAGILMAVIGLAAILLLCRRLPDAPYGGERAPIAWTSLARAFWIDPRRYPDFAWAWLSRFALYFAFAGVTTYQAFYLADQVGVGTPEDASRIAGVGTIAQVLFTVVGAGVAGSLSDRVGRRKPFVIGAALIGLVALVFFAVATSIPVYLVAAALTGLAMGCYVSVDVALVTALLPGGTTDAGKNLGVVNIANMLPNTIAPAIAPLLLSITAFSLVTNDSARNYSMLFLVSAVWALVSALSLLKVRSVR